jgi:lipopolysaccharide export system protein LptC
MTVEATLGSAGQRYHVRTAAEGERAFRKAERHSGHVAILRKALPVFAVAVLAGYFISTRMSVTVGDVTASISGVQVTDGALRMTNPKFQGTDKKNGAYVIGAEYADQDLKNTKIIRLHAIKADLTTASGWSRMEAARGVYNSDDDRLVMLDKITVATSSGITGELTYASLDTKDQILRAHQRVHFELPNGTVKANALTFSSHDHVLTFRGNVHVHIIKPQQGAGAKSTGDKPPVGAQASATQPNDSAATNTAAVTAGTAPQTTTSSPDTTGTVPDAMPVPPLPPLPAAAR